jgi:Helicase conserved C-terminal domain
MLAWFAQPDFAAAWSGTEGEEEQALEGDERARAHWAAHVEAARAVAESGAAAATSAEGQSALGKMPDDLVDVLAQLAIGGPAVTMFRALLHVVGGESALEESARTALRNGAGRIAWAFRALFNQPEVMMLLRGAGRGDDGVPYWKRVLTYCVDGCLQATLDEYVHVLRDHLGLVAGTIADRVHEIADEMVEAIELRTSRVGIDDIARSEAGRTVTRDSRNLRTHFALRYGDERSDEGDRVVTRADQVRKAFNSPFWPFVLATTSVGQEGLDFHTYCHAVVHWNVPSNPVDFEQREGRVHRFKGHAVRKNVASAYGGYALSDGDRDRWESIFERAVAARPPEQTDIVPFWVFLGGDARIERHVPALPLSRDRERAQRLRKSLAVYRMVFGQPRQEDLVAYLLERVPPGELEALMDELRIDLAPGAGV